jgi:DNA-directed RNA polymerase subunit RPC12/RpoP
MNVICGKCGKEYTIDGKESTVKCPQLQSKLQTH